MQRRVSLLNAQRISTDREKVPFRERNDLAPYNCGLRKPATTRGRAPFPQSGATEPQQLPSLLRSLRAWRYSRSSVDRGLFASRLLRNISDR
jgi:hypothetical protein